MSDLRKQPLVRERSTKFHRCYVGSLYVFGVIHALSLFSYINILMTAESLYGVNVGTTLEPYATYFNLVIFALVSNIIRIVLMFLTASNLGKFAENGYSLNIGLHIAAAVTNFLSGCLNGFNYDNSGAMYLTGLFSALLSGLAITLPILIYYKKRKNMFFSDAQKIYYNVIRDVPSDVKQYCENSRDTRDLYNYLSISVNVGTITQEQFNALNYIFVENADIQSQKNEALTAEESQSPVIENKTTNVDKTQEMIAEKPTAVIETQITTEDKPTTTVDKSPITKVLFCRKCGNRLIEDSIFCSKCGTKVIEAN